MVNKMVNKSEYQMFDEMLIVGFGISIKKCRELRKKRRKLPQNFMQMKIWKVLTEEQFNLLYTVLYNESIDIFIELGILMNEEWKQTAGKYNRKKKYKEYLKTEGAREKRNLAAKRYRAKNRDKINEKRRFKRKNKGW